ncbi:MAG: ribosome silencing factor [Alphaproteobacteria bacterium]
MRADAQSRRILTLVKKSIDDDKGQDVVVIDLRGRTSLTDFMVIATGTSSRHLAAMAEHLRERLKAAGMGPVGIEGLGQCDWVLIDARDVVIHLFRPEVRKLYHLEKMWGTEFAEPGSEADRLAL